MTWGRVLQIFGLILVGIWLTFTIVAVAALAGVEAAEHTEPGRGVTTIPAPSWAPAR